ncbi:MAG: tRNA threonylcarbamoyladenosine dehydratase [Desulfobulbaceae bacterium]|jgi:tRNA A37 threonylcarbamoyladenosine dehydratase|nr:tRNA threonylcarbamoyladenosine dehydratase [Desulfobulbaceae bacterium]
MEQFSRIIKLLGNDAFAHLRQSAVTVVGLGAVGGFVVEALARSGVGGLRLVDYDVVSASNINRQILALHSTIGQEKIAAAKERIADINPRCQVETLSLFASEETMPTVLSPAPDLLIDAIDSLNPKTQLLTAAYVRAIPTLSSMGAALRADPSQIRCGDLMATSGCPLARHLRKRLRRRGIGAGIGAVYSREQVAFAYDEEDDFAASAHPGGRPRHILGSLPTITAIFGMTLANWAILKLAGLEEQSATPVSD